MDEPEDYADRDLPPPWVPPLSTLLLFTGLVAGCWCCGLWVWLLSRVGPLGPDN